MMVRILGLAVAALLVSLPACDAIERARGGAARDTAAAAGSAGVTLNLEAPGAVRPGQEAVIRLGVWSQADTAISGLRAELLLPAWMEPGRPEPEGTQVTMVAAAEGTRLSYLIEPPLQPGDSRRIVQPVRTPLADTAAAEITPSRTLRAWLVRRDGQPFGAAIEAELALDTAATAGQAQALDTLAPAARAAAVERDRVGPVRLGMTTAEVRQAVAGTRDTTWTREGTAERGLVVPLPGEQRRAVTAELDGGRVERISVRDRRVRTEEGLGVGSRLQELRDAYGRPCADVGEDRVVVWFAQKPGISFVLDAQPPEDADLIRRSPEQIAGSATVTEMLVRRGADGC